MTAASRAGPLRAALTARLADRTARIAIVGCGYVGLPLGMAFAEAGFPVTGLDTDTDRVRQLNDGVSYILDVSSDRVRAQRSAGRFTATTDGRALADADIVFVSVPTPFDRAKQPD